MSEHTHMAFIVQLLFYCVVCSCMAENLTSGIQNNQMEQKFIVQQRI